MSLTMRLRAPNTNIAPLTDGSTPSCTTTNSALLAPEAWLSQLLVSPTAARSYAAFCRMPVDGGELTLGQAVVGKLRGSAVFS
jgi:hypothetical protein